MTQKLYIFENRIKITKILKDASNLFKNAMKMVENSIKQYFKRKKDMKNFQIRAQDHENG